MQRASAVLLLSCLFAASLAHPSQALLQDAGAPAKLADPVGQTYVLSTFRRSLTRPDITTLADLAATMRPGPSQQQQHTSQQQRAANATGPDSPLDLWRKIAALRERRLPKRKQLASRASQGQHPTHPMPAQKVHIATAGSSPQDEPAGAQQPRSRVDLSFRGLSAFDARYANSGNQAESGVPDHGLCVGNGFVLESVNNVLRVYDAATGKPLLAPVDHHTFYDYPPQLEDTAQGSGGDDFSKVRDSETESIDDVADPMCVFDEDSRRWFHTVLRREVQPDTGHPIGPTSLDIAVSDTADPRGAWRLYRIPPNNGQQGAPDVACESGFCFQGFPQMAVYKHAVVITANEFDLFGETFYGASVYAVSKAALVAGLPTANTALTRTYVADDDMLLASLQPARQTGTDDTPTGSAYLMAVPTGSHGNTLQLLTLQGTETLATQHARVTLDWVQRDVQLRITWTEPPPADQKPGVNPLGRVEFNTSTPSQLDTFDGRMGSVSYVDGKLFCTWGTGVDAGSRAVVGVAWAVVDPRHPTKALQSGLLRAPGNNHLLFPHMAVRPGGQGIVALSISGPDYHPSPAYAVLTREGLGQLTVITQGAGVLDGFLGYLAANSIDRVGDYSAAVLDTNGAFWVASGYVSQSCTVEEYRADTTCGGTRATGSNWATLVSRITLD